MAAAIAFGIAGGVGGGVRMSFFCRRGVEGWGRCWNGEKVASEAVCGRVSDRDTSFLRTSYTVHRVTG